MHELEAELAALVAKLDNPDGNDDIDALEARVVNLTKRLEAATACYSFESAVAQIRKRDACTATEALSRARTQHPKLFEQYQASGESSRPIYKAADRVEAEAVRRFEARINEIASRDRVSRLVALQRARQEHPDAFEAYQRA